MHNRIQFVLFVVLYTFLITGLLSCTQGPTTKPAETQENQSNPEQPATPTPTPDSITTQAPNIQPQANPESPASTNIEEDPQFLARIQQEKVRLEQQNIIVKDLLKAARTEASQERYSDAYYFVLEALKLKPDHSEALLLKKAYGQKLGYRPDEIAAQFDETLKLKKVQIDQTNLEVDNRISQGKALMKEQKYSEAISIFKRAKDLLRWIPYHVPDLEGKGKQLDHLIQVAEQEDLVFQEDLKKQKMLAAEEQARREEQSRINTVQEQIKNLYRQASLSFEQEKYDLAENFCNQVTLLDPENKESKQLIEIIRQARHAKVFDENRSKYLEEWKLTFAQIDEAMLPMHEIVKFPSYETWKSVSKRGSKSMQIDQEPESPQDAKIRKQLETEILPRMDFNDAPLREVVDYLRGTTNINIIIDPEVYKEFPDEESLKTNLTVTNLKLSSIFNWMLAPKGLTYHIANGVIIISTKKRIVEKTYLRLYNVRDLTGKLNDFPGMEIDLAARSKGEGTLTGIEITSPDARPATTITEEQLTNLIKDNIAKGSWKEESNSIEIRHGTLIIRQTANIHKQIESLLNDLRKATGLLVTIEARFLTVSDDFLEDVGVDWRSLGATALGESETNETNIGTKITSKDTDDDALKPGDVGTGYDFRSMDDMVFGKVSDGNTMGTGRGAGLYYKYKDDLETRQRLENIFDQSLGNTNVLTNSGGLNMQMAYVDEVELQMILKAVRKRSRSNLLTAPRLTVFNTQRANVTVVNQIAYVQDYNVEIATKATIADPIVGTIQDGVILDVRPIISADRKYITMELQPTVAVLVGGAPRSVSTQLASSADKGQGSIIIELPDMGMTKIRTTVTIPDGGTLLLGGLMEATRQDYTSGVPFLSDLPILNFFTSRRGQYSHKQNLLILVSAKITSMEEKEPSEGLQR